MTLIREVVAENTYITAIPMRMSFPEVIFPRDDAIRTTNIGTRETRNALITME